LPAFFPRRFAIERHYRIRRQIRTLVGRKGSDGAVESFSLSRDTPPEFDVL
jgi:hypothetical protein